MYKNLNIYSSNLGTLEMYYGRSRTGFVSRLKVDLKFVWRFFVMHTLCVWVYNTCNIFYINMCLVRWIECDVIKRSLWLLLNKGPFHKNGKYLCLTKELLRFLFFFRWGKKYWILSVFCGYGFQFERNFKPIQNYRRVYEPMYFPIKGRFHEFFYLYFVRQFTLNHWE